MRDRQPLGCVVVQDQQWRWLPLLVCFAIGCHHCLSTLPILVGSVCISEYTFCLVHPPHGRLPFSYEMYVNSCRSRTHDRRLPTCTRTDMPFDRSIEVRRRPTSKAALEPQGRQPHYYQHGGVWTRRRKAPPFSSTRLPATTTIANPSSPPRRPPQTIPPSTGCDRTELS